MDAQIAAALIAASAALIAAVIGYFAQQRGQAADSISARLFADPLEYFLAGCGVGNSIAVLPLDGEDSDSANQSLQEVIAALSHIGVEEADLAPLVDVLALAQRPANPSTSEITTAVSDYFDAMNRFPSTVRSHSRDADYVWFRLGELLYRAATLSIIESPGDDGSVAHLRALEFLAERPEFPNGLKEELKEFVSDAKRSAESVSLYESANEIAKNVYALLR